MTDARPLVIAHRGACWDAPENTVEAFELAVEQGADYIEFDVRLARDGRLVICHDAPPDPCPPQMPTLEEALALLRGRVGLAVEVKDEGAAEPAVEAIRAHDILPEGVDHRLVAAAVFPVGLVPHLVGVNHQRAVLREHLAHQRLAAGDAAGESDDGGHDRVSVDASTMPREQKTPASNRRSLDYVRS